MLWDAMDEARPVGPHLRVWDGGGFGELTWDGWRAGALRAAGAARAVGVQPGTPIACVLTNSEPTCLALLGIWLAGGHIVSLPAFARGMTPQVYVSQLARIVAQAGASTVVVEKRYRELLAEQLATPTLAVEDLLDGPALDPEPPGEDDVCFVQYSSGSTSDPRGCVLTPRTIEAQLDILAEGLDLDPRSDRGVSWLPLSHDMGLFGCLMLSFAKGMQLTLSTPERFLRSPHTWFADCATMQATITAGPNMGLELASRAARVEAPGAFPMRKCVLGGERIEAGTLERAVTALGPSGLTATSLIPAYGLAEAVLAVTMTPVAAPPRVLVVDGPALLAGALREIEPDTPGTVRLVSAGFPLRDVQVRIDGDETVGEIRVRTPSLASGYLAEPAATAERFEGGELRTRDLGFLSDGELFVHGRMDDMLCVAGRNVWARDLEAAIGAHAGVRPGSSVVVDVGPCLVALAEPARGVRDHAMIARAMGAIALQTCGVSVDHCLLVAAGQMPKTPSGKIQRYRARELAAALLEDGDRGDWLAAASH